MPGRHRTLTTMFTSHLPSTDPCPVDDLLYLLTQLSVCPFLHVLNPKWKNFESLPLIPVTVLERGKLLWWGRTDKQTPECQASGWQDPCLPCSLRCPPWLLASHLWGCSHPLLLPDRGRACWKENRVIWCLSSSILDKRSNSSPLSLDRSISFSGNSNLTVLCEITSNCADLCMSSHCKLNYIL